MIEREEKGENVCLITRAEIRFDLWREHRVIDFLYPVSFPLKCAFSFWLEMRRRADDYLVG